MMSMNTTLVLSTVYEELASSEALLGNIAFLSHSSHE